MSSHAAWDAPLLLRGVFGPVGEQTSVETRKGQTPIKLRGRPVQPIRRGSKTHHSQTQGGQGGGELTPPNKPIMTLREVAVLGRNGRRGTSNTNLKVNPRSSQSPTHYWLITAMPAPLTAGPHNRLPVNALCHPISPQTVNRRTINGSPQPYRHLLHHEARPAKSVSPDMFHRVSIYGDR